MGFNSGFKGLKMLQRTSDCVVELKTQIVRCLSNTCSVALFRTMITCFGLRDQLQVIFKQILKISSNAVHMKRNLYFLALHFQNVYESNQQDATSQVNLLFLVSSTCFGRCFRPSPGALVCIYSIW